MTTFKHVDSCRTCKYGKYMAGAGINKCSNPEVLDFVSKQTEQGNYTVGVRITDGKLYLATDIFCDMYEQGKVPTIEDEFY